MAAILAPSPIFEHAHEHGRLTDAADETEMDLGWTPAIHRDVSDTEVEKFVSDVADYGVYENELGETKAADPLFRTVAQQWVLDREAVGEIIGPVFWHQARAKAWLAKYGK